MDAEELNEEGDVDEILELLVADGKLRVVGINDIGETQYAVTPEGELHIDRMLDDALELAVQGFAMVAQIPAFIARDLLIRHVVRMVIADE